MVRGEKRDAGRSPWRGASNGGVTGAATGRDRRLFGQRRTAYTPQVWATAREEDWRTDGNGIAGTGNGTQRGNREKKDAGIFSAAVDRGGAESLAGAGGAVRLCREEAEPGRRHLEAAAASNPRADRAHPGDDGRWASGGLHRVPGAALDLARAVEGRRALRAGREPGRGARAGELDDVEVRSGQHPVRRGQGRYYLRPAQDVAGRTGADDATLHRRVDGVHRAGEGRARARHGHQ